MSHQNLTDNIDLITLVKKSLESKQQDAKRKIHGLITIKASSVDRRKKVKLERESRKGAYTSKH